MPTTPMFIQAESVSREYRLGETASAPSTPSLRVEKGEFLALLGSSVGKSTVVEMCRLDRPLRLPSAVRVPPSPN